MNAAYADLIRSGEGTVFVVDDVEEAAMGVRALIDEFFLQWLEESDWTAVHARYKTMCVRAILRYLGARRHLRRPRTTLRERPRRPRRRGRRKASRGGGASGDPDERPLVLLHEGLGSVSAWRSSRMHCSARPLGA